MEKNQNQFEITRKGSLEYYSFTAPEFDGIVHGFFTRRGGVSSSPVDSLNLGGGLGDSNANIIENRRRILNAVNRPENSVFDVWQIHSTDTIITEKARGVGEEYQKGDAIFTQNSAITLLMRFADCVPILMVHPGRRIIGIIHAGWQGTLKMICVNAVDLACNHYFTAPGDWIAGIGPSIGPDHYRIGQEVEDVGKKVFAQDFENVFLHKDGSIYMNLWEANRNLLRKAGVQEIYSMDICTACDTSSWFSHRAENGKTGRFAGLIGLG